MGTLRFIGAEVAGIILAVYTVAFLWGMSFLLDALNAPDSVMAFAGWIGILIGAAFNGFLLYLFGRALNAKVTAWRKSEDKDETPE